jgi:hypothetical protein
MHYLHSGFWCFIASYVNVFGVPTYSVSGFQNCFSVLVFHQYMHSGFSVSSLLASVFPVFHQILFQCSSTVSVFWGLVIICTVVSVFHRFLLQCPGVSSLSAQGFWRFIASYFSVSGLSSHSVSVFLNCFSVRLFHHYLHSGFGVSSLLTSVFPVFHHMLFQRS